MKINKIYIKSYIAAFVLFTPLWFYLAPTNQEVTYDQPSYEVTYIEVGKTIPVDHELLRKQYDYDAIEVIDIMNDKDEDDMFIDDLDRPMYVLNYRNDIIANRHGLAVYIIVLYKQNRIVHIENLGYHLQYVTFDQDNAEWIPLNQHNFTTMIEANPNGKYYLEEDINLQWRTHTIDTFSGIIVNPFHYVITGLKQIDYTPNQGIFNELKNAIIDGLIINDALFEIPNTVSAHFNGNVGFIASKATRSFISNTHVTGNIHLENYPYSIGGLIGYSVYSLYRYVSFAGTIGDSGFVGGIIGMNSGLIRTLRDLSDQPMWTDVVTIENAYVDADLASNDAVAGFIGNHADRHLLRLKSVYVTGTIDRGTYIYPRYIGYLFSSYFSISDAVFEYAYTTESHLIDYPAYDDDQVTFIQYYQLFYSTPLEGLEAFVFSTEDIPRLTYWEISS